MKNFLFDGPSLKVASSFLGNVAAGWFLAAFVAANFLILIVDLFASIMSLYLAVLLERELKNHV